MKDDPTGGVTLIVQYWIVWPPVAWMGPLPLRGFSHVGVECWNPAMANGFLAGAGTVSIVTLGERLLLTLANEPGVIVVEDTVAVFAKLNEPVKIGSTGGGVG